MANDPTAGGLGADELLCMQTCPAGKLTGETAFVPFVLTVLRIEDDRLVDIAAFEQPSMFTAFGLPARLPS